MIHSLTWFGSSTLLRVAKAHCIAVWKSAAAAQTGRLIGTRGAWMLRYAHLMNALEFTKFVTLTKDLAPFVVVLIDPAKRSRRQDRSAAVTRRNLEFILNGHPDAVTLFNEG
jgi:hypothetical protein